MASDNTKIIIICNDQRELQIMHDHLRKLSDELNIFMITDQSFYEHVHVCFGNTIGIWLFVKEYSYTDCFCCDYFAISTFDPNYIKEWQKHLSPHGKELINFDDIRNKIKELVSKEKKTAPKYYMPIDVVKIKNVIFNPPATIVFWTDGTKTVVKAQDGYVFDPEKGLAMAISKKALGNKGNYCNELKKWLPKKEETIPPITMSELADNIEKFSKKVKEVFGGK